MRGDQDYVLSFGSLDFSPLAQGGSFRYFVTGLTRGQPSPVVTAVTSLLQNGSLERVDRYENRDLTLLIGVEGDDAAAMSAGEAALFLEAQKERNALSWRPPGGAGATTVFRILWASLAGSDADDWDLRELQGERFYTLTLRAEPFARSAVETTVTATPSAAAPATVDPGTSAANWSTTNPGGTVSTATYAGRTAVRFSGSASAAYTVVYSGTLPTQAYVGLVTAAGAASGLTQPDGSVRAPVASEPVGTDGVFRRYWFNRPTGLTSPMRFTVENPTAQGANPGTMYVGGLVQAAGIGAASLLAIPVGGSAPTTGRVTLSRTTPMSWATVFTDPAMAMGAYHPAIQATWANAPQGTYVLWMEPRSGSVVEVSITDAQGDVQSETLRNTSGVVQHMRVGEFTFGGRVDGKVGPLTITVKIDGSTVAAPARPRLFRRDSDTSLTSVLLDATLATGASTIVVEAPSVTYPMGALFADGAPVGRRFVSWEDPTIVPPLTYMFVEGNSSDSDPIAVSASFFPAWHTNAAT